MSDNKLVKIIIWLQKHKLKNLKKLQSIDQGSVIAALIVVEHEGLLLLKSLNFVDMTFVSEFTTDEYTALVKFLDRNFRNVF